MNNFWNSTQFFALVLIELILLVVAIFLIIVRKIDKQEENKDKQDFEEAERLDSEEYADLMRRKEDASLDMAN